MGQVKTRGLYEKFRVIRTDGKSAIGQKHDGCEYFVLDLDHDEFAWIAIDAYARACADKYPKLAADLKGHRRANGPEEGAPSDD